MIDKKYTDKDIISSLEVIATTCNCNECKIRSGKWGTCNCSETTANAALDLINHQKAEIERLNNVISNVQLEVSDRIEKQIKAEAYKEFADRLKKQTINNNAISVDWLHSYIDNLVKEIVDND